MNQEERKTDMRRSVAFGVKPDWMVDDDLEILQWLYERDIIATSALIALNADIDYEKTRKRIRVLENHGMVRHPSTDEIPEGMKPGGKYLITDLGQRFVTGDITVKELREYEFEDN